MANPASAAFYGMAFAALALAVPAAAIPVPASEADPAMDEAAVRTFLGALPSASSALPDPVPRYAGLSIYAWQPTATGPYFEIDRARFRQLIAPCEIRQVGHQIIMVAGRTPHEEYDGVVVIWACAGPTAVARRLSANFETDHGRIFSVNLRVEPETGDR